MSDLLLRLETHAALKTASPGFHLSEEDIAEIIRWGRGSDRLRAALKEITQVEPGYVGMTGLFGAQQIALRSLEQGARKPEECRCTDDYQYDPRCDGTFCAGASGQGAQQEDK
jgi:hypothetical protein